MTNVIDFPTRPPRTRMMRLDDSAAGMSEHSICRDWGLNHLAEPIVFYLLMPEADGRHQLLKARNHLEAAISFEWQLRFKAARGQQPTITVAKIADAWRVTDNIRSALAEVLSAALACTGTVRRIHLQSAVCAVDVEINRLNRRGASSRAAGSPTGEPPATSKGGDAA